jgi:hypothetical protein
MGRGSLVRGRCNAVDGHARGVLVVLPYVLVLGLGGCGNAAAG